MYNSMLQRDIIIFIAIVTTLLLLNFILLKFTLLKSTLPKLLRDHWSRLYTCI